MVPSLRTANNMQCVILAGGLGTRISVVANNLPKALIPIGGRPFALHQLEWLRGQGVSKVLYCIGHMGNVIRTAIGDGASSGLRVCYSDEKDQLRGTGGALRMAYDGGLLDDGFLVLYADSYLPIQIPPLWLASNQGREPTMVVIRNEGRWDRSNVDFSGGKVRLYKKGAPDPAAMGMHFIDYGLSVLTASVVADLIPSDIRFDLADLYSRLSEDNTLLGHEVHERFYEIGSPAGLADLKAKLDRDRKALSVQS